jgi:hypothetical protein
MMLKAFWHFLHSQPTLVNVLKGLEQHPVARLWTDRILTDEAFQPGTIPIANDQDHAAFAYHILRRVEEQEEDFDLIELRAFPDETRSEHRAFKHDVLMPLCDYLDETLDDIQSVLGLLVRYKKRCEWFNREMLSQAAKEEDKKDYAAIENTLKEDLYRYLHDQGVEFTIEPYSLRGRIDLILDQKGDKPVYIEGKVFDRVNRNKSYIKKGFGQLLTYMEEHNTNVGYLAIYKVCEERLVFDTGGEVQSIPLIRHEGKT